MTLYILFATVATGVGGAHAVFGLQFALLASLSAVLAVAVLFSARRHLAIATLGVLVSGIFLIAARVQPDSAPGPGTKIGIATLDADLERVRRLGEKLFQERECIGCHRPDQRGIGPVLTGQFGRPVAESGCGALAVDEDYVRESILNPSAVVVAGFQPVMPSFAGQLTEEEMQALIVFVKSAGISQRQLVSQVDPRSGL
jgi:mono/diheme cytochrome c family protein